MLKFYKIYGNKITEMQLNRLLYFIFLITEKCRKRKIKYVLMEHKGDLFNLIKINNGLILILCIPIH